VGGGTVPVGQISVFSGRGTRVDGRHLLDIVSPGNYDVYSTHSSQDGSGYPVGSYRQFSGTSAAGPHVAAACALVSQKYPSASMEDVAYLITSHAGTDAYTGSVYNDTWGWGKLRILNAVGVPTSVDDMANGAVPPRVLLDQNYPNPFNPTTWIPFFLTSDGPASIKIYDVRGGLVKVLTDKKMSKGAHSVRWNGDDGKGRNAASGVYFCVLKSADGTQARKLVLLR
ncbi:MAG: S8 family serine peptidase, partial [Candidatus Krumholzibacteria bacterium]|nr:S8 family serine peptidase [Candidatus Krumholzibacteria bacterium]